MLSKKNIYSLLVISAVVFCTKGITSELSLSNLASHLPPIEPNITFPTVMVIDFSSKEKIKPQKEKFWSYLQNLYKKNSPKEQWTSLKIEDEQGRFKKWIQKKLKKEEPALKEIYNSHISRTIKREISTNSLERAQEIADFLEYYLILPSL